MSDQEYDESALLEESGGENEIETETNETAGDEENDPVSVHPSHSISQYQLIKSSITVTRT